MPKRLVRRTPRRPSAPRALGTPPSRARAGRSARARAGVLLALAAVMGLAGGAAPGAAQEAFTAEDGIALGAVVEPFEMEDLEGNPVDLAEVIGRKPVLVEFWATWCPVCRVLDPKLIELSERFGEQVEFLVVAVGVAQTTEQVARHVTRFPVSGRLLWDGRGAAARAFEAPGTGYTVLLDASGTVVWTGSGPEQDVESALRAVID